MLKTERKIHFNRRVFTFLMCILLSAVLWLVIALSKDYTETYRIPVKFISLPKDRVVSNPLPDAFEIDVRSNGFKLTGFGWRRNTDTLRVSASSLRAGTGGNYYILTSSKLDKLNAQLGKGVRLVRINPDTVYFNFSPRITKNIPVKPSLNLSFDKDFQQAGAVEVIPAEVNVSGASAVIEKIKSLETVLVKQEGVNKNIDQKVKIKTNADFRFVELSETEVQVKVPVTKFTESSIEVPIEAINIPQRKRVKIFPDKVKVKFLVSFEDYDKIKSDQFRLVADFARSKSIGGNKLRLELLTSPKTVKQVRFTPQKAEFIIIK